MAIRSVGPNSDFPTIAAAMQVAGPGDTIQLEAGYSHETATILFTGMVISGSAASQGIVLNLGPGIATVTLTGAAPFHLNDAGDANGIVGNAGDNQITVTAGADAVDGGAGEDRLVVDYRLASGAVTGDSSSNFRKISQRNSNCSNSATKRRCNSVFKRRIYKAKYIVGRFSQIATSIQKRRKRNGRKCLWFKRWSLCNDYRLCRSGRKIQFETISQNCKFGSGWCRAKSYGNWSSGSYQNCLSESRFNFRPNRYY